MSDKIEYIRKGFLVLLPVLDEKGRAIIHGNFDPDLMGEELVDEVRRYTNSYFKFIRVVLLICYYLFPLLIYRVSRD